MRAIPMSEKPGLKQVLKASVAEAEGDQPIRGSLIANGLAKDSNAIRDDVAEPMNQELGSAWPVAEDKGKVTEDSGKEEFVDCSEDYAMDELDRLLLLPDTTVDCNFPTSKYNFTHVLTDS